MVRGFVLMSSYHDNWCRTSDNRTGVPFHLKRDLLSAGLIFCRGEQRSIDINTGRVLLMKNWDGVRERRREKMREREEKRKNEIIKRKTYPPL